MFTDEKGREILSMTLYYRKTKVDRPYFMSSLSIFGFFLLKNCLLHLL